MAKKRGAPKASSLQMIVSDDKQPKVTVKAGMRLNVVSTVLVGPDLKKIKNIGARLCGGGGTCMALIDIGDDVINPAKQITSRRTK